MGKKIFKTSEDIVQFVEEQFNKTGLNDEGVVCNIMSVTKSKNIIEVKAITETEKFKTHNSSDGINIVIYETAFDRLTDVIKEALVEGALSKVSYNLEKEKLTIDTSPYGEVLRMRNKYPEYLDYIETALLTIEQIAEEEKEAKADN